MQDGMLDRIPIAAVAPRLRRRATGRAVVVLLVVLADVESTSKKLRQSTARGERGQRA
jgi:hypothetical protein